MTDRIIRTYSTPLTPTPLPVNLLSLIPLPTSQTHPAAYAAMVKLIVCDRIFPREVLPGGRWYPIFKHADAYDPETGFYDTHKMLRLVEQIMDTQVLDGGLLERMKEMFEERERIKVVFEGAGADVLERRVVAWCEGVRKQFLIGAYNAIATEVNETNHIRHQFLPKEKLLLAPLLNKDAKVPKGYPKNVAEMEALTEYQIDALNKEYGYEEPQGQHCSDEERGKAMSPA